MTEDQAKARWCPFVRAPVTVEKRGAASEYFTANRTDEGRPYGPCLASACMAWRWSRGVNLAGQDGYCGLAGRPE